MKRFHHGHQPQFYIYDFMYVDPETVTEEEYLTANRFFLNTIKVQLLDQYQNIGLDLVASVHKIMS